MSTLSPTSRNVMEEIARRANVSTSTVSRVLNGETKGSYPKIARRNDRIRQLADQLNYRPTFRGRAFQGGKTHQVALLYSHEHPMLDGVYGEMIGSAVEAFRGHNYHLTLWGLSDADSTDMFLDKRFDGFLVHHELSPTVCTAIKRSDRPAVLINAEAEGYASVSPDDEAGARTLTSHLLDLGHRRIAYIYIRYGMEHISSVRRRNGYAATMIDAGLKPAEVEISYETLDITWSDVVAASGHEPTAVIFYRSRQAAASLALWRDAGIDVPGRVSVAAFNNSQAAQFSSPAITVMDIPFREMGQRAADRLCHLIDSESADVDTRPLVLPETLIKRPSTQPPFGRQTSVS